MTEDRYKIEVAYWKQKAKQRFRTSQLNKAKFLVIRKRYRELEQKYESSQQEVDILTIPIKTRFEILDL